MGYTDLIIKKTFLTCEGIFLIDCEMRMGKIQRKMLICKNQLINYLNNFPTNSNKTLFMSLG